MKRWLWWLAAFCAGPAVADRVPIEGAGDARWQAFYAELDRLRQGQRQEPLRILQLGDSHTAADHFPHALRARLQTAYGDAGPGWLQPGAFRYYRSSQVRIRQSEAWSGLNALRDKGGVYGLGGFAGVPGAAWQTVIYALKSRPASAPAGGRVELHYQADSAENALHLYADERALVPQATESSAGWHRQSFVYEGLPAAMSLLNPDRRALGVAGLVWEFARPGVVVDALGTSGAMAGQVREWAEPAVMAQLRARDPALIILAFGTNEAYSPRFDVARYRAELRDTAAWVDRVAPRSAVLVIAPPDALVKTAGCRSLRKGRRGRPEAARLPCVPGPTGASCAWRPHPNLEPVRNELRRHALERGWRYWDWSRVMGGACGAHAWQAEGVALYQPDRVHLTQAGYERSGALLYEALLDGH